jgi:hypothetical protein
VRAKCKAFKLGPASWGFKRRWERTGEEQKRKTVSDNVPGKAFKVFLPLFSFFYFTNIRFFLKHKTFFPKS